MRPLKRPASHGRRQRRRWGNYRNDRAYPLSQRELARGHRCERKRNSGWADWSVFKPMPYLLRAVCITIALEPDEAFEASNDDDEETRR